MINANARLLNNKIESLIEVFDEYDLSIALLSETWFKNGPNLHREITDLSHGENIGMIARNRCGRGGGVAIAYRTDRLCMKEFKLPGNKYEMTCAVGNTGTSNRKIAAIALYIPPRQKSVTTKKMKECLIDGINKLKTAFEDPLILVGGDTNNRDLEAMMEDFPDIDLVKAPPTRRGAFLDQTACNFCDLIDDTASDHSIVRTSAKFPNVHHFVTHRFRYQPISEKGKLEFIKMVTLHDWATVMGQNATESADALCKELDRMVDLCFPYVWVKYKSSDSPWVNKKV